MPLFKKIIFLLSLTVILIPGCAKEDLAPEPDTGSEMRVFVSGSAAVTPLLKELAGAFAVEEPDIEVVFLPDGHSKAGVEGAATEQYDIGALSREMVPDEKENLLRYLHLAVDGLVFITHPNVTVSNLSSAQLRGVYSGQITNWSHFGGPNAKITVIDRPDYTSAKIALRKAFLGDNVKVTSEATVVQRPWQMTDAVQMSPYSIGYTSLGEIISDNPPVKIMAVNRVEPTPVNLKNGRYRFFRPFGLVLGRDPKLATMRFVNFIFSETGSKIIEKTGYVPQRYEILIGIVPEQNMMVQSQRYKPLTEYLSRQLGEKFSVKLKLYPTYIEVCRALARGEINAAFLGSLAYATVRRHVDVIARPDYGGVSTYRGILFVRSDSDIKTLSQARGRRLVMGGKTTTAGYVFPLYYFKKHGVGDYTTFFSESNFVGTHEDAILAVLHNRADVGAAKDLIFNMIARENPFLKSSVRILAESPAVPSNAFVIRKDLSLPCFDCHSRQSRGDGVVESDSDMNIGAAIKKYLLEMPDYPDGRKALAAIGNATRFVETTDEDYSELYEMLDEIRLHPETLLRPAPDRLSADKKR